MRLFSAAAAAFIALSAPSLTSAVPFSQACVGTSGTFGNCAFGEQTSNTAGSVRVDASPSGFSEVNAEQGKLKAAAKAESDPGVVQVGARTFARGEYGFIGATANPFSLSIFADVTGFLSATGDNALQTPGAGNTAQAFALADLFGSVFGTTGVIQDNVVFEVLDRGSPADIGGPINPSIRLQIDFIGLTADDTIQVDFILSAFAFHAGAGIGEANFANTLVASFDSRDLPDGVSLVSANGNEFSLNDLASAAVIPLPPTFAMMAAGLGVLGLLSRRRRRV